MAHIPYLRSVPFGAQTASVVTRLTQMRSDVDRLMSVANSLTNGGSNPELLETGDGAANFGVPAGEGQTFYISLQSIQAGVNAISAATLANMDLG